ncbi:MAG: hypothetical protein RIR12_2527 [Bacteroidota bacterium]|jgi:hypothetical protein
MKCSPFFWALLFVKLFLASALFAQDTLPKFTVKSIGINKVSIRWKNNFEDVKQISIQSSKDSMTGYKTILTVADPTKKENTFLDLKASSDRLFYRLYILRDKGYYIITKPQLPLKNNPNLSGSNTMVLVDTSSNKGINKIDTTVVSKVVPFSVVIDKIPFSDSVKTPDLTNAGKTKPNAFTPSLFVYTEKDGYVRIQFPAEDKPKKYTIKFFDQDETLLFELKEIKAKTFKLDKTNFYHAGWFTFELYEENTLIEKHKFYLAKDF